MARFTFASAVFCCVLLTAACGPLQYAPKGAPGGGYSETQLAPNMFDVHYTGRGTFDAERITDFLLLRSAELCTNAGFSHFEHRPLADQTRIESDRWIPLTAPPGTMVRTICHESTDGGGTARLNASFVAEKLRDKYGLVQ